MSEPILRIVGTSNLSGSGTPRFDPSPVDVHGDRSETARLEGQSRSDRAEGKDPVHRAGLATMRRRAAQAPRYRRGCPCRPLVACHGSPASASTVPGPRTARAS